MQHEEINHETQILRAQMMRNMPEYERNVAIRGGVRMRQVIDARERFYTAAEKSDPYCDGDVA